MTTLVRLIARPAMSAVFLARGVQAVRKPQPLVPAAEPLVAKISPPLQRLLPAQVAALLPKDTVGFVRLDGAVHVIGGALLAVGRAPRLASAALALSLVPTTVASDPFWRERDPEKRSELVGQLLKNLNMLGGLLLASVDTAGKPGVPWRARRATRDLKRGSKAAKREAKLSVAAARAKLPG